MSFFLLLFPGKINLSVMLSREPQGFLLVPFFFLPQYYLTIPYYIVIPTSNATHCQLPLLYYREKLSFLVLLFLPVSQEQLDSGGWLLQRVRHNLTKGAPLSEDNIAVQSKNLVNRLGLAFERSAPCILHSIPVARTGDKTCWRDRKRSAEPKYSAIQ